MHKLYCRLLAGLLAAILFLSGGVPTSAAAGNYHEFFTSEKAAVTSLSGNKDGEDILQKNSQKKSSIAWQVSIKSSSEGESSDEGTKDEESSDSDSQGQDPSQAGSEKGEKSSETQEETSGNQEGNGSETSTQDSKGEETTGTQSSGSATDQEDTTGRQETNSSDTYVEEGDQDDDSQYENDEVSWDEAVEPADLNRPLLKAASSKENHNVLMPEATSHYFSLQRNSKKISQASGQYLKLVADAKGASKYLFEEYPNGASYNFTPRFSSRSKVTTGGGNGGGVAVATIKSGTFKHYGELVNHAGADNIADRAYRLDKCTVKPYATYTNVGTFYDREQGKTYDVDMRITVTGYTYPGEATRKALSNQEIDGAYVAFLKRGIGVVSHATDNITLKMDFYYGGTTTPIKNLAGYIQGCDIDAQQGIDFGSGFEKVVMFNTSGSHLQYNPSGRIAASKGYVSSRVVTDFDAADGKTTAIGIFSGSSASMTFTLAKCDRKDTGGGAKYGISSGFGVPADTTDTDNKCYRVSNSTGLLIIRSDVHLIPIPDGGKKKEYSGEMNSESSTTDTESMVLELRDTPINYVLSMAAAGATNVAAARYTTFGFEDILEPVLKVNDIKVFRSTVADKDEKSAYEDVTSLFTVDTSSSENMGDSLSVMAKEDQLKNAAFYGYTYYLHIQASIRPEKELQAMGLSLMDYFQEGEGEAAGRIRIGNKGQVMVVTNMGNTLKKDTNIVTTDIGCMIPVRKLDQESGKPVAGVEFGLFGGEDVENPDKDKALMTAKTREDGIAVFRTTQDKDVYSDQYGDGPYVIKELSVPDTYKDVWSPSVDTSWKYVIRSLKKEGLYGEPVPKGEDIPAQAVLTNKNRTLPKGVVRLQKTCSQTGEDLSGGQFMLMEWSEKEESYHDLDLLTEIREKDRIIYQNKDPLVNTMDNLGHYRIVEIKAPEGCVLTGEAWMFDVTKETEEDGANLLYRKDGGTKKDRQTGDLHMENSLQKGRIRLIKADDQGQPVPGAVFIVKAAKDIYAPWSLDEEGQALKGAEPLVTKGAVVDELVTGKEGVAETAQGQEYPIGDYEVREKESAGGHVKSQETYKVSMKYGDDPEIPVLTYTLNVTNNTMKPSFAVSKLADRTRDDKGEEVDYDSETGRYVEKKIPAIYKAREETDYKIRITNTGNVPLYRLILTDVTDRENEDGQALITYIENGEEGFILPESGSLKTDQGHKASITRQDEAGKEVMISRLAPKDSLEIHYKIRLSEEAKDAYNLINTVYGKASYNIHEEDQEEASLVEVPTAGLVDEEGNSLVMDEDRIHIPGDGKVTPLKTADRTTGILIEDGAMVSGSKVPGVYHGGEEVNYTILVKNTGTASLKNITVEDTPGEVLMDLMDDQESRGFIFGEGEVPDSLTTQGGDKVSLTVVSKDKIILCSHKNDKEDKDKNLLKPGDYLTLTYQIKLKSSVGNRYDVVNTVAVNGWYFDGTSDISTRTRKDRDRIEIPGNPEGRVAKLADRTTGVVLKDGRYESDARISGAYVSGETVHYKITITNNGKADLYHLELKDQMSEELRSALDESTITFVQKEYTSEEGRKVRTALKDPEHMILDFLGSGDRVDVELKGNVKDKAGNLLDLENTVHLTASYKIGNEEEKKTYQELADQKWVKLIYHANDGSDQKETDSETPCQASGKVWVNGPGFSRKGYRFTGWNDKADGSGTVYMPDAEYTMPDKDADLYAQWTKADSEEGAPMASLVYLSNNPLEQSETDEEGPVAVGKGICINENSFRWAGYDFTGWNEKADGKGQAWLPGQDLVMPEGGMILYAQWKKSPVCKLVYEANNGSGNLRIDGETPAEPGREVTLDGNPYTYEKEDLVYRFTGWNTRPGGEGDTYQPGETMKIYEDKVVYAQWEVSQEETSKKYLLIYHGNNGTAARSIDSQVPAARGDDVKLDDNSFTYPGKKFLSWNTKAEGTGNSYNPGTSYTMPGHDVHLYAQWQDQDQVTLTYDSNTDHPETLTDAQTPVETGKEIKIDGPFCKRKGYGFIGWNTKKDGSGTSYSPGDQLSLNKDEVLYAQWTRDLSLYKLIYDSNLSGKDHLKEVDGETPCLGGKAVTVNPNRFRIPGKIFIGWNTKKDGSGKTWQPEEAFLMEEEDKVLYAQWQDAEDTEEEEATGPVSPDPGEQDSEDSQSGGQEPAQETPAQEEENREELDKAVGEAYEEIRDMKDQEALDYGADLARIPETDYLTDQDKINVPGVPELVVAKLADRTDGVQLEKGRYTGKKIPGTYCGGEKVDYTITVTNRGSADLQNLILTDTLAQDLAQAIDLNSLETEEEAESSMGQKVKVTLVKGQTDQSSQENEEDQEEGKEDQEAGKEDQEEKKEDKEETSQAAEEVIRLTFDSLKSGDSLAIHLRADLRKGASAARGLNNYVKVNASYQVSKGPDGSTPVEETDLMEDDDQIDLGVARLTIAKLADKTSGVKLKNGRYQGTRKAGSYKSGDIITYKLTVTNTGSAPAQEVRVEEKPTESLLRYTSIKGYTGKVDDYLKTALGNKVKITALTRTSLTLDRLEPGDSVELRYQLTVQKNNTQVSNLDNLAYVYGRDPSGSEIPQTEEMRDNDKINLTGTFPVKTGNKKSGSKTSAGGKTGDYTPFEFYMFLLVGAGTISALIFYFRKRREDK